MLTSCSSSQGPTYQGDLTSSFEDIILVPLASWVFLFLLAITLPYLVLVHNRTRETGYGPAFRRPWHLYIKVLACLGVIAMSILEMIRLANLKYGIGLLPFTPATTAIAIAVILCRHSLGSSLVLSIDLSVYWALSIAFQAVKLHTQIVLRKPFPRVGSQYPASDQITDLSVLIGCLGVLLILELIFPETATRRYKSEAIV